MEISHTWVVLPRLTGVTTPFTRAAIHAKQLLDERWVVDDPDKLLSVVQQMITERDND